MARVLARLRSWLFAEDGEEEVYHESEGGVPLPIADKRRKPAIISLHGSKQDEIFVRHPKSQEDALVPADCLKVRRPVVVNLELLDQLHTQRVFDFLKGVVYGLEGHMEKVGDGIYLLTPRHMAIESERLAAQQSEPEPAWREY